MQKLALSLFLFLMLCFVGFSQAPNSIPYQAVIRNSSGVLIANQPVKLRLSLHDSIASGVIVYQETQFPNTNTMGMINIFVGKGAPVAGSFANINWSNNSKFLQVEIDVTGATNYTDLGTQQLMSVPFALYSNKADSSKYASNGLPENSTSGDMVYYNGTAWVKLAAGGYGQSLVMCDGVPTWGGCLPKVSTSSISSISYTNVNAGGIVLAEGGFPVTTRGVCWGTNANPSVALTTKTDDGSGTGDFTSSISGLTQNTTYHLRAYATNSVGTGYGADSVFTTRALTPPSLMSKPITDISQTTASGGGIYINDGGTNITEMGLCWSTSPSPTVSISNKKAGFAEWGQFSINITGLVANTTYYLRAYAINSVGVGYGAEQTFTTLQLSVPSISTAYIGAITATTAKSGGNITSDGGLIITGRGVCWSTSPNPTIELATKTDDGSEMGSFTSVLTGLTAEITYYVRAYATNNLGTSYGPQISFIPTAFVANLPSVTIGSQIWSSKNLDVSSYLNGDTIPQITDPVQWATSTTGAWCWFNNDSATYAATLGRLYNLYAFNDPRGLAPQGWHLPTDAEWNKLLKYLDPDADTSCISDCNQSVTAVRAMCSTIGWNPIIGATNSSGFSALPSGYRNSSGFFSDLPEGFSAARWWSTSNVAYHSILFVNSSYNQYYYFSIEDLDEDITVGFSVRVVRD